MIEGRSDGWEYDYQELTQLVHLETGYKANYDIIYQPTPWCDLRFADEAIARRDFDSVSTLYTHALTFDLTEPMRLYISVKQALALALGGRMGDAQAILDGLTPIGSVVPLVESVTAAANRGSALEMCQSAYDFFVDVVREMDSNFDPNDPQKVMPKTLFEDDFRGYTFGNGTYDPHDTVNPYPTQAGCNPEIIVPTPTMTAIQFDEQVMSDGQAEGYLRSNVFDDLANGNYDQALIALDTAASVLGEEYADHIAYLRALTLEFGGRDSDAAAGYAALADSAPDTAWGRLARIHIRQS